MTTADSPPDRTVLSLKLQTVNRHIEHFEGIINHIHTGAEKILELEDFALAPVSLGLRDVFAQAWQGVPSTSLIHEDLAEAERQLGEGYAAAKAEAIAKYTADLSNLRRGQKQRASDDQQIQMVAGVVGSALAIYNLALDPARRLRQRLVDKLGDPALGASDSVHPSRTQRTEDDRDQWIYQRVTGGIAYKQIIADLAQKQEWSPIESIQGIRNAAQRYADRHGKPRPASRQRK